MNRIIKTLKCCIITILISGNAAQLCAQSSSTDGDIQKKRTESAAIMQIKGAEQMEKAYFEWIKKYPQDKFPTDSMGYDYLRNVIAKSYALERNTAKASSFLDMIEVEFWKGNAYGGVAETFLKNGDTVAAAGYLKRAVLSSGLFINNKRGNSNSAQFAASAYSGLCYSYADIAFRMKNYAESLKFTEMGIANDRNPTANALYLQATSLESLKRNKEAFEKMITLVNSGKATADMAATFKRMYTKVKGSEKGFDSYAAGLRKGFLTDLNKRLNAEILNEPAIPFTLKDMDGKEVSLASLKGKVVILDFWATWCGPCKASFPAMQMAVDKYKNDEQVKFLFIHSYERSTTATEDAKSYISSMKYTFQVLMDTKDSETKNSKVAVAYKATMIPAKFIIDKSGTVRFKLAGFEGSKEAAVDELSMMIDILKSRS